MKTITLTFFSLSLFFIGFSFLPKNFSHDESNDISFISQRYNTDYDINNGQEISSEKQLMITTTSKDIDSLNIAIHSLSFQLLQDVSIASTQEIYSDIDNLQERNFAFLVHSNDKATDHSEEMITEVEYWQTLYSIETKQGKMLYRPRNRSKTCATTKSACGHHQLTAQALRDIKCTKKQCKKDREDFKKSLAMSKQLNALNAKRMLKSGYKNLPEYQQYLIHQQGATGIKTILAAVKGKKLLSKKMKKNMANNSPYSYKKLKRMGSKLAAKQFMKYWQTKWQSEKRLVSLSQNTEPQRQFSEYELQVALNIEI